MTPGLYFSHPACLEHDPRRPRRNTRTRPSACSSSSAGSPSATGSAGSAARRPPRGSSSSSSRTPGATCGRSAICAQAGGGAIDPDTFVGEASFAAALHAAGGACRDGAGAAARARPRLGFCARAPLRPPRRDRGARWASACSTTSRSRPPPRSPNSGLQRVFILDWDVHHGNGTAGDLPRALGRAVREPAPGRPLSRDRLADRRRHRARAGAHDQHAGAARAREERLWLSLLDNVIAAGRRGIPAPAGARLRGLRRPRAGPAGRLLVCGPSPSRRWLCEPARSLARRERRWAS